jgi:hypothetical protein
VGLVVSRTWSCSRSSQSEISLPDNGLGRFDSLGRILTTWVIKRHRSQPAIYHLGDGKAGSLRRRTRNGNYQVENSTIADGMTPLHPREYFSMSFTLCRIQRNARSVDRYGSCEEVFRDWLSKSDMDSFFSRICLNKFSR